MAVRRRRRPGERAADTVWVEARSASEPEGWRKGGSGTVGAVTNSAVTARARTRRRAAGELTGRAERDARIAAAAARVSAAQDTIRGNAERRALAVATAQRAVAAAERAVATAERAVAAAERAVAAAERDERDANAAADQRIDAAVRQLRADGLTVATIAELLHLPAGQVRGLVRRAHLTAAGRAAAASAGTAAPGERRGPVSKT